MVVVLRLSTCMWSIYKVYNTGTEMGITCKDIKWNCVSHEYWIKWSFYTSTDCNKLKWIGSDTLYELQLTVWDVPIEGTSEITRGTVIVPKRLYRMGLNVMKWVNSATERVAWEEFQWNQHISMGCMYTCIVPYSLVRWKLLYALTAGDCIQ